MSSFDESRLLVDFGRLQETSAHLGAAIVTIESQLTQLERDAAPLVHTWVGEAQQAYHDRQVAWRNAANELATVLNQIRRALDDSLVDYQGAERHNANLFR